MSQTFRNQPYKPIQQRHPVIANWKPVNTFKQSLVDTSVPTSGTDVSFVQAKVNIGNVDVDLAPTKTPKFLSLQIDGRFPDAYSIIGYLDKLAWRYGQSPYIRQFVVHNILCGVNKDNDKKAQIDLVIKAARKWITYVNDPVGGEYFISPVKMVEQMMNGQKPKGDCDDHVLFCNACLISIGIESRAVGVHLNSAKLFDHVISGFQYKGKWFNADLCAKAGQRPEYKEQLIYTGAK